MGKGTNINFIFSEGFWICLDNQGVITHLSQKRYTIYPQWGIAILLKVWYNIRILYVAVKVKSTEYVIRNKTLPLLLEGGREVKQLDSPYKALYG